MKNEDGLKEETGKDTGLELGEHYPLDYLKSLSLKWVELVSIKRGSCG